MNERVENSATDDGVVVTPAHAHVTSQDASVPELRQQSTPPTADRSVPMGAAVAMSGPRSVHATSDGPKPPPTWQEEQALSDDDDEPCGPTKPRLDGTPELCRQIWNEFCGKQSADKFRMNPEVAQIAAELAVDLLPSVARAAVERQLELAPGSLTDGTVQIVRMAKRSMEAEVVVLDPAQKRMRAAYVRLIGPDELSALAEVVELLKTWEPRRCVQTGSEQ